ncbi:MAG: monovalent cation:proton antiporter-2 (CPA2) family protein [Xanthomonadales bacterium]|nr:monovalent cation:proton antiporter-2 (CPA2) family protein [Xanthomonadales bacterium]
MADSYFMQAFVYLAAAVIAVPIAKRLGLGSALGYLLAGLIIGPNLLGLVGEEGQDVMHFAEFGVVLMLFLVGLELQPSVLWRMRVPIIGLGGLQVVVTTLIIALLCVFSGFEWQTAVVIGLVFSMSSTAIVLQTLDEKSWMKTVAGQSGFSVLLFQDVAVIFMLAAIPFLSLPMFMDDGQVLQHAASALESEQPRWQRALSVLGVVVGIVLAGRFLTRPIFRYIAKTRSGEIFIATALLVIVVITLAMGAVGLSPALGTFVAGVVMADSEFRHELEISIEPFKGLLLGLFFIAVGASIDLQMMLSEPVRILGLVLGLMVLKFVVLIVLGRAFKLQIADNLMFGFLLAQGGEFAFLLVSFALQSNALNFEIANQLILVVVLSMVLTPIAIIFFEKVIQPRLVSTCSEREDDEIDDADNPVIIAGFGRFGQVVSRMLKASGFESTLLDHDAGQIELSGRYGNRVFYGDAANVELLRAAGAERARLLVIAIDDRAKAMDMIHSVKMQFPGLKILIRAFDRTHAYELIHAGADFIARETFGSALAMGEEALRLLGHSDERAKRLAARFDRHDTEGMYKLSEVWGDDHEYGIRVRQNLEDLEQVLQADLDTSEN